MRVSEKRQRRPGCCEVDRRVAGPDHILVFIARAPVDELSAFGDGEGAGRQLRQTAAIALGKLISSPLDRPLGGDIEMQGVSVARNFPVMVSTNANRAEIRQRIHDFGGIRAVADDISAAHHPVIAGGGGLIQAGLQRIGVRMDVAEDEVTHGVMMKGMRLQRILGFSAALAFLTAVAAGLAVKQTGAAASPGWVIISEFIVALMFGGLGLFVAHECKLPASLVVRSDEWQAVLQRIFNWGVLPGLVLGIVNYLFFFPYRYHLTAGGPRDIHNVYDSFIVSLKTGTGEEVMFRLFILSCLVFSFQQLYAKLQPVWPALVSALPVVLALVLSSLLFALVHGVYSFTAAFFGGMLLGLIYLRNGIESAIAAHFAANFLFYSVSYLS